TVELSEDGRSVKDADKLHKYDAAFYSKRSMNISGGEKGDGVLNITAQNEGLDSELHLTLNGGIVNITSGNDGINTNEDNVSVTTVNGGELNITVAGWTGEGDGIDSNGWLVINGGSVTAAACDISMDAGIDSDKGIYINGGSVCASGGMLDHIAGGEADYAVFSFSERQTGGSTYTLRDIDGNAVAEWSPVNDFTNLVVSSSDLKPGTYTLWTGDTQLGFTGRDVMMFGGFGGGRPPEMPEGFDPQNMPEPPERPEGMPEPPQGGPHGFGHGFGGGRGGQPQGEWTAEFTLDEGGNTFGGVMLKAE
ncbi:MAG: carbohydrate-binding domain-containing protein, partial [Clostridia bacterium]|nr:carbohydrate-binding domain-containing protein [Clostridia bacterium]